MIKKLTKKWDEVATDYQRTYKLGQSDYSTAMLGFWEENGMFKPGMRVLDIGCGVGKYGVIFAKLGCDVTLTDISAEMLRHASENMSAFNTPWQVYQCDFNEFQGNEEAFSQGFDFSICTMSPAIHDVCTVRKMSAMTKGWCFVTRFSQWKQLGRDALMERMGLESKPPMEGLKEDCAVLIQAVSSAGYVPQVKYVDYKWCDRRTPQEMAEYLQRSYLTDMAASPQSDELLCAISALIDDDGLFEDAVNTKVAWIYWDTGKR